MTRTGSPFNPLSQSETLSALPWQLQTEPEHSLTQLHPLATQPPTTQLLLNKLPLMQPKLLMQQLRPPPKQALLSCPVESGPAFVQLLPQLLPLLPQMQPMRLTLPLKKPPKQHTEVPSLPMPPPPKGQPLSQVPLLPKM